MWRSSKTGAAAIVRLVLCLIVACSISYGQAAEPIARAVPKTLRLYIATLTAGDEGGIFQAQFDAETGKLDRIGVAGKAKNSSFLAFHPSVKYLYATCDVDEYANSQAGALAAFEIDAETGKLTLLNHQSSIGAVPCHVSLDRDGKHALIANWLGGSIAVFPIRNDGTLGESTANVQHTGSSVHKVRQAAPHPHSINLDPASRYAFVADAGIDQVLIYRFDKTAGTLVPNQPAGFTAARGAAPRHLTFHPNGKWTYVINELDNTVSALHYNADRGAFELMQNISTLPDGEAVENLTSEIIVHPSGKFLYGSNRGHDSLAMFAIDQSSGRLTALGQHPAGGHTPRSFAIDPTGKFLLSALQDSDRIVVHQIDPVTGKLKQTDHQIDVPKPLCVKFVP